MRVSRLGWGLALAAAPVIAFLGCGEHGAGRNVVSDACVSDDTATLRFDNDSPSEGYDVVFDGTIVGSVGASRSITREVPAGTHEIGWLFAGTDAHACPTQTADVAACDAKVYTCAAVDPFRCLHRNYGTVFAQNTHEFAVTVSIDGRAYVVDTFGGISVDLEAGVAHEIVFAGPDGVLCAPAPFILEPCQERIVRC